MHRSMSALVEVDPRSQTLSFRPGTAQVSDVDRRTQDRAVDQTALRPKERE